MESFEALKMGLIIINFKGDLRHRNSHASEHVPKGFSRWATASSYLYDVERILQELEIARSFVEKLPGEDFFKEYLINPEDYIMYHQGYFLDLMHQLKDKLSQLLYAVIVANKEYSSKDERNVTLAKLMKGKLTQKIPHLTTMLEVWNADIALDPNRPKSPITIALKKRKNYHHHKNPLTSEENYFRTKSHRVLLKPATLQFLSEDGKEMIAERGKQSGDAWQADSLRKMTETLKDARANINTISKAVVSYFKLPQHDSQNGRRIMLQYMPLEESIKIPHSRRTIIDVDALLLDLFNLIHKSTAEAFPKEFVSMYAIGSATRDDFMFGISDINVVIVLKTDDKVLKEKVQSFIVNPPVPIKMPLDLTVVNEDQFKSSENEKLRFFCKTDGILIGGQDLLKNEKDLRKSYEVVWMLNKDFKEKFLEIKVWALAQTLTGSQAQYAVVARNLSKYAFRLCFGQVMGNNAVYATRYKDMKYLMNFYMPENKEFINQTYRLITNPLRVDKEGLLGMIRDFERMLVPLFDAIDQGVNGKK